MIPVRTKISRREQTKDYYRVTSLWGSSLSQGTDVRALSTLRKILGFKWHLDYLRMYPNYRNYFHWNCKSTINWMNVTLCLAILNEKNDFLSCNTCTIMILTSLVAEPVNCAVVSERLHTDYQFSCTRPT